MIGALATINLPNQTLLFSDGIQIDREGYNPAASPSEWEITSEENGKVYQINPQVGVLWHGDGVEIMPRIKELSGPKDDVKQVANLISKELGSHDFDTDFPDVNVYVTGYDQSGTYWGSQVFSNTNFTPCHNKLKASHAHFMFPGLTNDDIEPKVREFHNPNKPPVISAMNTFCRLTNYYKEQGLPVGGNTFIVKVEPPKSLFQDAIRSN